MLLCGALQAASLARFEQLQSQHMPVSLDSTACSYFIWTRQQRSQTEPHTLTASSHSFPDSRELQSLKTSKPEEFPVLPSLIAQQRSQHSCSILLLGHLPSSAPTSKICKCTQILDTFLLSVLVYQILPLLLPSCEQPPLRWPTHHQCICSLPDVFHFLKLSPLPSNHSLIIYRDNLPQLLKSFKISSLLCLALSSSMYLNISPPFPLWGNWLVSVLYLWPWEHFPPHHTCSPLPLLHSLFYSQPIASPFPFLQRSSKKDTA